jgi:hypothetical protein
LLRHTPRTSINSLSAPRREVEPRLAASKTAADHRHRAGGARHHTRKACSPSRSRTWSCGLGRRCALQNTHGPQVSRPGFEPGPGPSEGPMRSATPSGRQSHRADDWIRTSMNRFTKPAPFSLEPRRQARARGVEPRPPALETGCRPRSTLVYLFISTVRRFDHHSSITTRRFLHLFALDSRWRVMHRVRVDKRSRPQPCPPTVSELLCFCFAGKSPSCSPR